jgi:CRP/FNR family cyclic AMP-dependent transcriptional regulator
MYSMETKLASRIPLFDDLDKNEIKHVLSEFTMKQFHKNEIIFQQDSSAEYFYILSKGEVFIRYKPYDGPPLVVTRIYPGDIFGWSAVLQRQKYTSTATAEEDSQVYQISGNDLLCVCAQSPGSGAIILQRLATIISARLQGTHREVLEVFRSEMNLSNECWKRIIENE